MNEQQVIAEITNSLDKYLLSKGVKVYFDSRTPAGKPVRAARFISYGIIADNPLDIAKVLGDEDVISYATNTEVYLYQERGVLWVHLVLPEKLWQYPTYEELGGKNVIGLGDSPVTFEFLETAPHTLIAGTSGSGKSQLLITLVIGLISTHKAEELRLAFADPHQELGVFDAAAHTITRATTASDITTLLNTFNSEVLARKAAKIRLGDRPRLVLVIDEAQSPEVFGRKTAGLNTENVQTAQFIAAEARKLGVNMIIASQKPTYTDLPFKDNLVYRLIGQTADTVASSTTASKGGTGTEKLLGMGDFIKMVGPSETRFQAAMVKNPDKHITDRRVLPDPYMAGVESLGITALLPEVLVEYILDPKLDWQALGVSPAKHREYVLFRDRLLKALPEGFKHEVTS